MIAFTCHHCGASLRVEDRGAGRARPCPACSQIVRAPVSGPSPSDSARASAPASGGSTVRLRGGAEDTVSPIPDTPQLAPPPDYPFLAPPIGADEMGRLGP